MSESWQGLVRDLEEETNRVSVECPDEIKRFHYGIISHSDAGKYALNQYFGHWVHTYAEYYYYGTDVLPSLLRMVKNPSFSLDLARIAFRELSTDWAESLADYSGQISFGKYLHAVLRVLDTLDTKEAFEQLIAAFQAYVTRLYWWMHWYFPWGLGVVACRRLSPGDVVKMAQLSGLNIVKDNGS